MISTKNRRINQLGLAAALVLTGGTVRIFADPAPVSIAPPVSTGAPAIADSDSTFQWTEVPQNQKVPLTRAVFDQNGYQLFDTAGETVLVPFTDNNLYVMKFAPSPDGTLYLINQGDVPVLYVPAGGYLENAAVAGARWYPFPDDFRPAQPVFLGAAPSWSAFVSIGWTPGLVIRGGYYGDRSFVSGGVFLPTAGLAFEFGGENFRDFDSYHAFAVGHPYNYHYAGADPHLHVFRGAGDHYGNRADGRSGGSRSHVFRGGRGDRR